MASRARAHVTTDHNEIRRWAEERNARPTCVRGTGGDGDIGMLRLDFPGYSGEGKLEEISWGDWFAKFDERGLALLYQDATARGEQSDFNKIIARETAKARSQGQRKANRATARAAARSTRSTGAGGRSRISVRGRKTATASRRGKAISRRKATPRSSSRTRTTRAAATKKTSRGVSSRARTRRRAA